MGIGGKMPCSVCQKPGIYSDPENRCFTCRKVECRECKRTFAPKWGSVGRTCSDCIRRLKYRRELSDEAVLC